MIHLTFNVNNVDSVLNVYNRIEVASSATEKGVYTTMNGVGVENTQIDIVEPFGIILILGKSKYKLDDPDPVGEPDSSTWYISRYYTTETERTSDWSDPILGDAGEICYSVTYPVEVGYGTSEQLVVDRIRRLIGDPVGLKHEYDEKDNIHEGGKVYELSEKGWPCSINIFTSPPNINTTTYTSTSNPAVNGYRYLDFSEDITTISGVELKVDIFYYTFRHSDREIWEAYATAYPPAPLTISTATSEVYMLQTSITLLGQEIIEDSAEDGAIIVDESSRYDNTKAIQFKIDMSDRLQKRLDIVIKSLLLCNITGVLID